MMKLNAHLQNLATAAITETTCRSSPTDTESESSKATIHRSLRESPAALSLFVSANAFPLADELAHSEDERKRRAFQHCRHRPIPSWKRAMDIVISVFLAVLLLPVLAGISLLVLVVSGRPVLFRQKRLGEMGREFVIFKFRTLHESPVATEDHRQFVADLMDSTQAAAKPDLSKRMIPGGRLLRSTSLDELPQLLNILRGEMSLIGPRPDVLRWEDYEPEQLKRFEVLPGVTGLWQVSGKNKLTFNEMVQKDLEYIQRRSLRLDMSILLKTIKLVARQDNN
ncbi:MAG: sugar transferase [Pirellulaceae bacterium]|nr:sugar transferase [Pirellulaceae bacterium]